MTRLEFIRGTRNGYSWEQALKEFEHVIRKAKGRNVGHIASRIATKYLLAERPRP